MRRYLWNQLALLRTLRVLYWIPACHYDPLCFIIPFTTCAKVLLQQLWTKPTRGWNDPDIKAAWMAWEGELPDLSKYNGVVQERTGKIQSSDNFTHWDRAEITFVL